MSTFSCSEELLISETARIDFVMILDMFFFFLLLVWPVYVLRLVSALCPVTLMMYLVCIWVASRICTDVVLKLWFVYFWLGEAFWLRTDSIVPANEKLDIMMLSNRTNCANSGHSDLHSAFTLWLPFGHITVQ